MEDIMKLCDVVRETGFAIHRYHKHGHLEKVYENALAHRLRKLGLDVKQQYPFAFANGVVEARQRLATRGGLDPEADLADFDLDKLACLKTGL
jgi:hypothetical protein